MAVITQKRVGINPRASVISTENKKNIEIHTKAAIHHTAAAKFHQEAAKHHEAGNHEKAHHSAVLANGHSCEAHDLQKEDVKHHALTK